MTRGLVVVLCIVMACWLACATVAVDTFFSALEPPQPTSVRERGKTMEAALRGEYLSTDEIKDGAHTGTVVAVNGTITNVSRGDSYLVFIDDVPCALVDGYCPSVRRGDKIIASGKCDFMLGRIGLRDCTLARLR